MLLDENYCHIEIGDGWDTCLPSFSKPLFGSHSLNLNLKKNKKRFLMNIDEHVYYN